MAAHFFRKPVVFISVFLLVGIVFAGWRYANRESQHPLSHREIATRVLAEYLGSNANARAVVVISNPFSQMKGRPAEVYAFENSGIEGLRKGFGGKTELRVVFPALKGEAISNPQAVPVDPNTKTPLSFLVTENAFEEVLKKNADCELAVSLVGLPLNRQSWSKPGPPKFGLLLPDWRMAGSPQEIRGAFQSGKIVAAVITKPGGKGQDVSPEGDYRSEFEERFFLVTKENVDSLLETTPELFR